MRYRFGLRSHQTGLAFFRLNQTARSSFGTLIAGSCFEASRSTLPTGRSIQRRSRRTAERLLSGGVNTVKLWDAASGDLIRMFKFEARRSYSLAPATATTCRAQEQLP